ncbi:MAG: helix-turn-helix transcriptional regulator [Acidobacteria bacterium]|nr:helix-turn-helix transcriptional regulator [Acidobacteriota bacterium]MBV9070581.1 helix-turn-helix transcriptional regulator [Acidobacteriota bacterium]MBV9187862.1 helix-turn-helix transcriptional regulator [Acidobacteriota bacterium]
MPPSEGELFGARLRELREQRGESQRSLAERTGSTHAYISQMERGMKVPTLTMIVRLAVALECQVTDLVDVFTGRDLRKLVPKR